MPVSSALARPTTTLNHLLERSNESYNDQPVSSSGAKWPKMVLFMREADSFVAGARGIGTKAEKIEVMRELAKSARSGVVAVTSNAARVFNDYNRELGSTVRVRSTNVEY